MAADHFAALGQPRRPWLAAAALKAAYLQRSREQHPDHAGAAGDFTATNAAYAVLREPAARVRHLLELECPAALVAKATPPAPELAEVFMRLATLQQTVQAFVAQQAGAETPLARALLAGEHFTLQRDVEREQAALARRQAAVEALLQQLSARWPAFEEAAVLLPELTYLARWESQLRETAYRLQVSQPAP